MNLQKNKYSRKLKDLDINNLKSARISEINNLRYNYFWGEKFDLVRENIPFFVMIQIPKILIVVLLERKCFWEENTNNFFHLNNENMIVGNLEKDINKKFMVLALVKVKLKNDLIICRVVII